jgi:hypothetical protein
MNYPFSDLRYSLIAAPISLEPLRVLDTRTLLWGSWRITFNILAASHAICLYREEAALVELLACAELREGTPCRVSQRADTSWTECVDAHHLKCRIRLLPCPMYPEIELLQAYPPDNRLTAAYPAPPGSVTPLTCLGWQVEPHCLRVETLHTYPEENRAVRTWTVFEETSHAMDKMP